MVLLVASQPVILADIPMTTTKIPSSWPTFLVKASWRGTSITLRIPAKDEDDAWTKASKKVMKMLGGISCLDIQITKRID